MLHYNPHNPKAFFLSIVLLTAGLADAAGQSRTPLDKSFIDKTIDYYYSSQAKQTKGTAIFFVERDSLTRNAKTDYPSFKVQFLSASEAATKIAALRQGEIKLDKLIVKWVSLDTIDVIINGCTIGQRKINQTVNRKAVSTTENFLTNCTPSYVDIPTCRFVYDPSTTKWTQVNKGKDLR